MGVTPAKRITSDNRPMRLGSSHQPSPVQSTPNMPNTRPAGLSGREAHGGFKRPLGSNRQFSEGFDSPCQQQYQGFPEAMVSVQYEVFGATKFIGNRVYPTCLRQLDDRPAHVLFRNASHSSFLIEARMSTLSFLTHDAERLSCPTPNMADVSTKARRTPTEDWAKAAEI
jgi:hypothetical protein